MRVPCAKLLAAALLAFAGAAVAADVPIRDFARLPQYTRVKLSPTGEYLAVAIPQGDQTGIAIIRLADMKLVSGGRGGHKKHVADFWWANPERVVIALGESWGQLEAPYLTGEMMAIGVKGSQPDYLYGREGSIASGSAILSKGTTAAGRAYMVSTLREVDDEVLIRTRSFWAGGVQMLARLNVRNGRTADLAHAPLKGGSAHFLADESGNPYFAASEDETLTDRTFAWDPAKRDWKEIGKPGPARSIIPLRLSKDRKTVYSQTRDGTDKYCLTEQDLETGGSRQLACHEAADLTDVLWSADGYEPLAAVFEPGRPEFVWINRKHPDSITVLSLMASFKDQAVYPVSWTADGRKLLFRASSDRNPGEYFLYDRDAKSAKFLLARSSWVDAAVMAESRPINYKTRDGHTVYGYLTLPPGRKPEKLPLVVMPHGGPFNIRDDWGWDPDAQVLASRGYAVLQVNFRGSGGYGHKHVESALRGWGTVMISDIHDGVRWTIAQGFVDPDRVCASGASYGAYSSVMLAQRDPDLVKCVVAYAGVYDLRLIRSDMYGYTSRGGRTWLNTHLGDDPAELEVQSPVNHVDKLKAPVFIVHGQMDQVATPEHAYDLRKALEARKHPLEWLMKSGEAHGFYNEDNRTEFYEKQLDFLDRHIGERRPAKPQ
jgi:dipeptidyl aminopeptidase/acylaminoacyl peptidase